jgi:nicotinate-nucleotide adenylyltransferase
MRIGVYGGSFDPPHVGHAMVAAWLRWTDQVDQVWLLPAFEHPFCKDSAPFDARVDLCRALAAAVGQWVDVCPVERDLPAPSYTIHTLDHLRARHPGDRFRLVVGADVLAEAPKWRAWDRITAEYSPIVAGRAGWPVPPGSLAFPAVSSTEVRARVRGGEGIEALVVAASIARITALYSATGSAPRKPTAS